VSRTVRQKAIRAGWRIAAHCGLVKRSHPCAIDSEMDKREDIRTAIVRAWECGYRHGKKDARQQQSEGSGG